MKSKRPEVLTCSCYSVLNEVGSSEKCQLSKTHLFKKTNETAFFSIFKLAHYVSPKSASIYETENEKKAYFSKIHPFFPMQPGTVSLGHTQLTLETTQNPTFTSNTFPPFKFLTNKIPNSILSKLPLLSSNQSLFLSSFLSFLISQTFSSQSSPFYSKKNYH